MRVLYVVGSNEGASKRYRVYNNIEALDSIDIQSEWIWEINPEIYSTQYLKQFTLIVYFRGSYSERFGVLRANARRLRIPIAYDIDDLVFDETIVSHVDAFNKMSSNLQLEYINGVRSMRQALTACDAATASTQIIADHIKKTCNMDAYVIPLGINKTQMQIADILSGYDGGPRYITYLSGTKTHDRDFTEAAPALSSILAKYDDVFLKIVGPLEIPTILSKSMGKIIHLPFMRWESLLIETAASYVNIAPLDTKSLFCNAKSNLKYFEAALTAIPTIASPIQSYEEAITSGINGYLANNDEEWYDYLSELIDRPERRDNIGKAARADVYRGFTPKVIAEYLAVTYNKIISNYSG